MFSLHTEVHLSKLYRFLTLFSNEYITYLYMCPCDTVVPLCLVPGSFYCHTVVYYCYNTVPVLVILLHN